MNSVTKAMQRSVECSEIVHLNGSADDLYELPYEGYSDYEDGGRRHIDVWGLLNGAEWRIVIRVET